MNVRKLVLALFFIATPAAHAAPAIEAFSVPQIALEAGFVAALAIDRRQTLQLDGFCVGRVNCTLHETNPILGRDPSAGTVNRYFLTATVLHVAVSALLSGSARTTWQASTLALEAVVIGHNKHLGLRIAF